MQERISGSAIVVFDIDGVIRDVGGSYRRALVDTVLYFTEGAYAPSMTDIDDLKAEGLWNNDWEASREMVYRYYEATGIERSQLNLNYEELVAFFQERYRGPDPSHWTGYICQEPLLLSGDFLDTLTQADIAWGFFSGATRGSAQYVLERRLALKAPVLIAMEDAPGKPDPTGLVETVQLLEERNSVVGQPQNALINPPAEPIDTPLPVIYAGDTAADMQTVRNARQSHPSRRWIGAGILPPHAQQSVDYAETYAAHLKQAGADVVLTSVTHLTPEKIFQLI
jgi:HAD superfamily phosphatase